MLAISVLDTKIIESQGTGDNANSMLAPSFPLRLRKTNYGPVLNSIKLSQASLMENSYRGLVKSVFFAYKTLHDLTNDAEQILSVHAGQQAASADEEQQYVLNARVISASLGQGRHIQLPEPVTLEFTHFSPNLSSPICVFWNFELPGWSDAGCRVVETNLTRTLCQCDHLTNFGLLMKNGGDGTVEAKLSQSTVFVLEIVTYVAVGLSLVFITIILYKVSNQV